MTTTYVIDGARVHSLQDFWTALGEAVNGPGGYFGRGLDSLTDCLRGGFGTPDDGSYVFEWRGHAASRRALGHPETARYLEGILARCHHTNRGRVAEELAQARAGRGPTLFDILTGIFADQAPDLLRLL
ncbi:barstar family protein [Streptomyces sp. NPDC046161]|uniref:barstar family protein n=1 Tax=Streptomyces sp. NPDC046161 TaxID=3155132 RepID=UPI0033E20F74